MLSDGAPGTIDLNAVASRVEPPSGRRRCLPPHTTCLSVQVYTVSLASATLAGLDLERC